MDMLSLCKKIWIFIHVHVKIAHKQFLRHLVIKAHLNEI